MVGFTTRKLNKTFEEWLNAIRDSISNCASSDNEDNGEDKDDDKGDIELGKLTDGDPPGCVMDKVSNRVQQHMECIRQKPKSLEI